MEIILFICLMMGGYLFGRRAEMNHYESIKQRERVFMDIPVTTSRHFGQKVSECCLVSGSVVIGQDYFKMVLASIKSIFGGRVTSYESLVDRARREAILRMKEAAHKKGAKEIVNMRLETSTIGSSSGNKDNSQSGKVEVFAYGTAGMTPQSATYELANG